MTTPASAPAMRSSQVPRYRSGRDACDFADPRYAKGFATSGLLVFEDFIGDAQCDALMAEANRLVDEIGVPPEMTVFSTVDHEHGSARYFLESGNKVRSFFEDGALDENGALQVPLGRAVNKLGHALHEQNPQFRELSRDPRIHTLCKTLGQQRPDQIQSMYIFKQPHIGGEVVWHQDSTFLYTDPPTVIGFWFALEAATVENGCLWALPGVHKDGLKRLFRRDGLTTSFDELNESPWDLDDSVPLEVERGAMVVLHGALPHWSAPNKTERSRHAYSVHVIDGAARYPSWNWLQRGG